VRLIALLLLWPILACGEEVRLPFKPPNEYSDGSPIDPADFTLFELRCVDFTPPGGLPEFCPAFPTLVYGDAREAVIDVDVPDSGGVACFDGRAFTAVYVSDWGPDVCTRFDPVLPPIVTVQSTAYELQTGWISPKLVKVGSVPLGVVCGDYIFDRYYVIPSARVKFTGKKYKGGTLLGVCK
jgi:hypothetical protein